MPWAGVVPWVPREESPEAEGKHETLTVAALSHPNNLLMGLRREPYRNARSAAWENNDSCRFLIIHKRNCGKSKYYASAKRTHRISFRCHELEPPKTLGQGTGRVLLPAFLKETSTPEGRQRGARKPLHLLRTARQLKPARPRRLRWVWPFSALPAASRPPPSGPQGFPPPLPASAAAALLQLSCGTPGGPRELPP